MGIFTRLDHVSIGVNDFQAAQRLFVEVLGGEPLRTWGPTRTRTSRWTTFNLGGKKVELVSPITPGKGGVGRYLAKHGEGYHHISIVLEPRQGGPQL